jgi:phosphoribosyl-ATP pyrophosphohydrolase
MSDQIPSSANVLSALAQVIESRKGADPTQSYVAKLFNIGQDAILKKIGEEATELVMASKDQDAQHIVAETADLWFHSLVLLASHNISHEQVLAELARRFGLSGTEEKANRSRLPSAKE